MQVEVANVKCGELGARAREDAVENKLGKFKGCCRGANVARKGDAISSDGDECAVGIAFLWSDLAYYFGVGDFGSAVGWNVLELDDEEGVGSLDALACAVGGGANTLAEAAEFVGVGVVPDLVEVRVFAELSVI